MIRSPAGFYGGDRIKRYLDYYQPSYGVMMLSAGQFSPLSLFAAGEQGAWYDPSDFSTMFTDAAGTTPVTAVEQPVGLIRDKSGRGNHASQSTDASRPVLSARVNLLTQTENFAAGVWVEGSNAIKAASSITNAGTSAVFVYQSGGTVPAVTHISSVELKKNTARYAQVQLAFSGGTHRYAVVIDLNDGSFVETADTSPPLTSKSYSITSVGDGWYRLAVSGNGPSGIGYIIIECTNGLPISRDASLNFTNATNGVSISVRKADLRVTNVGVNLPAYQRVGAAVTATTNPAVTGVPDYDTSGFPLYLKFDGVDDSLATGSINFSTTDKMSVFHGHRIAGTAYGVLVNGPVATYATFQSVVHDSAKYQGNISTSGSAYWLAETAAIYSSPRTDVSAILLDTAQVGATNAVKYRLNGTLLSMTGAIGGAPSNVNFGNMPLIIGMYPTSSNRFNGHLYSLIVRGAQSTDAQIASTETYVNNLTKAY